MIITTDIFTKVQPSPLLPYQTWKTSGLYHLQKKRSDLLHFVDFDKYPSPSLIILMAEYECEEGFELTPGNVPGRGFSNMNQVNSKKWDIKSKIISTTSFYGCHFDHKSSPCIFILIGFEHSLIIFFTRCGQACRSNGECCSYEFSPSYKDCNLNKECKPSQKKFQDFLFCKKRGIWCRKYRHPN